MYSKFGLLIMARQYGGPSVKFRSRVLGIGIVRSQNAAVAVTRRKHRAGSRYFSRETITVPDFYWGHWRSVAVQVWSEPENYHGTGFLMWAHACVRVQQPLQICLECRSKSKKCDKQLTHIVRVSTSSGLKLSRLQKSVMLV
jgi:hypothetical protein